MEHKNLAQEMKELVESSKEDREKARDEFSKRTIAKFKAYLRVAAIAGKTSVDVDFKVSDDEQRVLEAQGLKVTRRSWGDMRNGGTKTTISF